MLFRPLFDHESSTWTYLIASAPGREALIIDPCKSNLAQYLRLIEQLGLRLVRAIDTHTHADHVTALGDLADATGCATVMGEHTRAECVVERVRDGDVMDVDGVRLRALYTPGHTDESFSFLLGPERPRAVFTGDVLLIRGTGRTDFQSGDAGRSYDSITGTLFALPDETLVYPAHDYQGETCSSIGEEKRYNPRIAGRSRADYVALMAALDLPRPKLIDIAVPANLRCGRDAPALAGAAPQG